MLKIPQQKFVLVQVCTMAKGDRISLNGATWFTIDELDYVPGRFVKLLYNGTEKIFVPNKQVYKWLRKK